MVNRRCRRCGNSLNAGELWCSICGAQASRRGLGGAGAIMLCVGIAMAALAVVGSLGVALSDSDASPTPPVSAPRSLALDTDSLLRAYPIDSLRTMAPGRVRAMHNLLSDAPPSPALEAWRAAARPIIEREETRIAAAAAKAAREEIAAKARAGAPCEVTTDAAKRSAGRHPGWPPEILGLALCGRVAVGMTSDQVVASWGRPERANRSTYASGMSEQWVYEGFNYVYLTNGVVRSIQTSQ